MLGCGSQSAEEQWQKGLGELASMVPVRDICEVDSTRNRRIEGQVITVMPHRAP
jgi:hypothetical protein